MTLHYSSSLSKRLRNINVYGSKHRQKGRQSALSFKCIIIEIPGCSNESVFKRLSVHCAVFDGAIQKMFVLSTKPSKSAFPLLLKLNI